MSVLNVMRYSLKIILINNIENFEIKVLLTLLKFSIIKNTPRLFPYICDVNYIYILSRDFSSFDIMLLHL